MSKIIAVCGLLTLALVTLAGNSELILGATPADFVGNWVNVDSDTRGITRLNIASGSGSPTIEGFGSCSPTDCKWGSTALNLLAHNVSDDNFEWGIAVWDFGFAELTLTLRLEGDQLVAESFDVFKDNSGRSNYRALYLFRKE